MTTQSFIQPHYNTFAPPCKDHFLKINLNFSLFHRLRSNTPNPRRAKVETYKRFQYAFFKTLLNRNFTLRTSFLTNLTRLCSALPAIWAIKKSRKLSGPAMTILNFKRKYISKQTKMPVYT